jgi:hypothetical protein
MASNYLTRTAKKKAKKTIKKNPLSVVIALVFLVVFLGIGMLMGWFITSKDGFALNNEDKNITISLGGTYAEDGAIVTAYGVDLSKYLVIDTFNADGDKVDNIDTSVNNEYFVVYYLKITDEPSNILEKFAFDKYKDYQQVRRIIVGEGVNNG